MLKSLVLLAVVTLGSTFEFDCTTLVPHGRSQFEREEDNPFVITIDTSKPYSAGDIVRVKLSSSTQTFNKFVIQARQPMADVALGVFRPNRGDIVKKLERCVNGGDTLTNKGSQAIREVSAEWVVPSVLTWLNIANVEFDIAVVSERKFWIFNSQMIAIATPQTQNTIGRPHDPSMEEQLTLQREEKLQQQIEDEDNSEGEGQMEEMEKKRKHQEEAHKEEVEAEELKSKMERERMRIMQFEIQDKEEHEREKARKADKADGGKLEGDIGLGDMVGRQLG